MGRLDGKAVLITGAGKGIGRAAAILFAQEGARVVIAEIDRGAGEEAAGLACASAANSGGDARFIETDITKPEQVAATIDRSVEAFGKLDVLYNNAGGATSNDGPVTDVADDEFWRAIGVDLYGTFLVCKHGIPALIKAGGGSIINSTSNAALKALPGRDCYTAAKGGVASLTRSMAAEYAPYKIRVNAIAPGAVRTERVARMMECDPNIQAIADKHLLGICEPIHVAQMALYLASDDSRVTTGQVLSVDSGLTIV